MKIDFEDVICGFKNYISFILGFMERIWDEVLWDWGSG